MEIRCIWEHNGSDTLLYAENFIGAYTRGKSLEEAKIKMPAEIKSYLNWCGQYVPDTFDVVIVQEKDSELEIKDADSDVLFYAEENALTLEEYNVLKALALKSAADFLALYESIPDKNKSNILKICYKTLFIIGIFLGVFMENSSIWNLIDYGLVILGIINIVVIIKLRKEFECEK